MKIIEIASVLQRKTHYNQSGRALLPALKLRQKGLVTATSGLSPLRDFHSIKFRPADIPVWLDTSRERLLRATRHYAFGSVAKKKSGVDRKSATSVGLTNDLVHWLQAGKTVAIVRFASKFHRLASALRTASVASLPTAGRLPAGDGHRAAVEILRIHRGSYEDSLGCHQSERRWLLNGPTPIGVPLP